MLELKEICTLIFMGWQAIEDLRDRTIRMDVVLLFLIPGVIWRMMEGSSWSQCLMYVLVSCLPGSILLLLSFLWKGQLGEGDGLILLVVGMYLGVIKTIIICYVALIMVVFAGTFACICRMRRKEKVICYPFAPFVLTALVSLIVWRNV